MPRLLALALLVSAFGASAHADIGSVVLCYEREPFMEDLGSLEGMTLETRSSDGSIVKLWIGTDGRWVRFALSRGMVCVFDIGDEARLAPQPQPETKP